jgi:hypothetical protein
MIDNILKESYMQAQFEEEKTSQSDHAGPPLGLKFVQPKLSVKVPDAMGDGGDQVESPHQSSPTKVGRETLISFDIKTYEILKKEDCVVSTTEPNCRRQRLGTLFLHWHAHPSFILCTRTIFKI